MGAMEEGQGGLDKELIRSAEAGDLRRVEELLAAGADPKAAPYDGDALVGEWERGEAKEGAPEPFRRKTALMAAAGMGHEQCMEALLPGSDLKAKDSRGFTPLMHALIPRKMGRGMLARLAAGSDLSQRDWNGMQALDWAAMSDRLDAVEMLLPHCDPRKRDDSGGTALMHAASHGAANCVEALLGVSDPLAADSRGVSALMMAAAAGSRRCVELLLPASDPLAKDKKGMAASDWARQRNHGEVAKAIGAYALAIAERAAVEAVSGHPSGPPSRGARL